MPDNSQAGNKSYNNFYFHINTLENVCIEDF